MKRIVPLTVLLIILGIAIGMLLASKTRAEEPQVGTASWFGPGDGVATQWCTWTLRHTEGCGLLAVQSHRTGITVIAPVIDWCQCYRGTSQERIVDLQWSVVDALGLDRADGLYAVTTWRVGSNRLPVMAQLPNTAMETP